MYALLSLKTSECRASSFSPIQSKIDLAAACVDRGQHSYIANVTRTQATARSKYSCHSINFPLTAK
jgi:hypothetical protein